MVNIEHEKCTGCGKCVSDCVAGNLTVKDGKSVCGGLCILCGHCVAICPSYAVTIPEYDMQDVEAYDKDRFGFNIENFIHTVKFRRSIRQYKSKPIERERLERIIQAGRYTATGANRQACQFVVIQDELTAFKEVIWSGIEAAVKNSTDTPPNMLTSLRRFTDMRTSGTDYLFRDAPAVVYIAAESTVDAALAAQNMEMAAIAQGLGVLFNGFLVYAASMNPAACEWLEVKNKPIAVCMLMGYPRVTYQRTAPRREADVRWL